ncbi:ATP-binding cassette sub-family C member 4-like isoform X2 [Diprion similis]|uniref:ATP-binding cassette sub-family C member 4-like isoform X2 n=1 Tax=Diprion similis TaxID=362088 RepID=UPI001EF87964|nr:ATP-binding cassette sub-family C member 4-like isoform X2 [Diprion similis]
MDGENMDTKTKTRPKNPKESANFLSRLCFGWALPTFLIGVKRELQTEDLYNPLHSNKSESLGDRLEREWKKELAKVSIEAKSQDGERKMLKRRPNLIWPLIRVFWFQVLLQGTLCITSALILNTMQPLCQRWLISHFRDGENQISQSQALQSAATLVFVTVSMVLVTHHSNLRAREIGMCMRIACSSVIYRKVLRLDLAAVNNVAAGKVVNLISNDVARFDNLLVYFHLTWIVPLQLTLYGYIIWRAVGLATLAGLVVIIIQATLIQGTLSRVATKLRTKIAVKTDERVQLMSEMISGIQVVKMHAWESSFEMIVAKVRALEIKLIAYSSYIKAISLSMPVFSGRVAVYMTITVFALMDNSLTAEVVFTVATLLNILRLSCTFEFSQAINMAGEASVSLKRITDFLLLAEVEEAKNSEAESLNEIQKREEHTTNVSLEHRTTEELESLLENKEQSNEKSALLVSMHGRNVTSTTDDKLKNGIGVKLVNVAGNWVTGQLPPTLCEVSLKVKSRLLSMVVGTVGSGKSSLLHLLLGELPVGAGKVSFYTGENNKKNRISIRDLRISYTSQDAWLFSGSIRDNILFGQAFDSKRYEEVTRVCALVKDFEQLPQGDLSFVGERGASLSGGQRARVNLARAIYKDADIYLLDDPLSAVDTHVGRQLFEECIKGFLSGKTRILVTHQLQYLRQADYIIVLDRGTVKCQGTYDEVAENSLQAITSLGKKTSNEAENADENDEENMEHEALFTTGSDTQDSKDVSEDAKGSADISEEEVTTRKSAFQVFTSYFLAGGNLCWLTWLVATFAIAMTVPFAGDYWLTYWINHNVFALVSASNETVSEDLTHERDHTTNVAARVLSADKSQWFDGAGLLRKNVAVEVYTALIIATIFLVILNSLIFVRICMNASRNIHNFMFANLLRAPMRFFNTNPIGRILNRFSKDVGAMDEFLPTTIMLTCQIFTTLLGIFGIVTFIMPLMIIPVIVISGLLCFVIIYSVGTIQGVKRLEGITKSPVFSQVSSTLDGLTTIRSHGMRVAKMMQMEYDQRQDDHTSAYHLTIATSVAFACSIDLITCLFTASVCFSLVLLNNGSFLSGSVGLAISQCLLLTGMVQFGVRLFLETIAQIISVERLLQYTNLPQEGPFETDKPPPPTWPSDGSLVFNGVSMKYAEGKPPVLKDLNLSIKPGWKVGIVGRTGAGKSSLISALFRLTGDGLEGEILLDGIDTKSIGLQDLRPRISIIPQEPTLFSASLRYNLDPFNQYSDAELWDSLREVELANLSSSLDFRVATDGANFSVGQRQLICLARAVLRSNRLLVLDEATANIDRRTDALIQKTIRRKFADCTVLTIAHRLNTIMDSDRVLVMERGRIEEFGSTIRICC